MEALKYEIIVRDCGEKIKGRIVIVVNNKRITVGSFVLTDSPAVCVLQDIVTMGVAKTKKDVTVTWEEKAQHH